MSRPKIYATGNETLKGEFNISYYIFEKDPSFLDWLGKLLVEVFGLDNGEQQAKFVVERRDTEDEDWVVQKVYVKDINKMIDVHEKYFSSNQKDRIDVFYGKERVYVTLRKSREIRRKFAQFVRKTKDWIKIEEVKEFPLFLKEANKKP